LSVGPELLSGPGGNTSHAQVARLHEAVENYRQLGGQAAKVIEPRRQEELKTGRLPIKPQLRVIGHLKRALWMEHRLTVQEFYQGAAPELRISRGQSLNVDFTA
jgi:hypothetical protein